MERKRLFRSTTDKKIGGVCGGLAEYFDIDPLLVRLLFIILVIVAGGGVLLYLILWIITPEKPASMDPLQNRSTVENPGESHEAPKDSFEAQPKAGPEKHHYGERRHRGSLIGALVLITLGVLFLADEFIPHINFGDLWPIILIVIGIGLLLNSVTGKRN
jgi:phage shock protein PspC (stress-responsive transcriptional regulator)